MPKSQLYQQQTNRPTQTSRHHSYLHFTMRETEAPRLELTLINGEKIFRSQCSRGLPSGVLNGLPKVLTEWTCDQWKAVATRSAVSRQIIPAFHLRMIASSKAKAENAKMPNVFWTCTHKPDRQNNTSLCLFGFIFFSHAPGESHQAVW